MHLYKNTKHRIGHDRPHGVNIPCTPRRLIKAVSGDTLSFTANVVCPATREPVKKKDLQVTRVYVAVAENRFTSVMWAGSTLDGWIKLDDDRPGLIHITVPRTVMNVLRRGTYSFSVVVDDGVIRETQMTGNFQIEYEPTGSINDIPYRNDQERGNPISLTPEVDLAAQKYYRLTYDQMVSAVDTISRTLATDERLAGLVFGACADTPHTEDDLHYAVHRLAQFILWNDDLRARIPSTSCDRYNPSYDEFVERLCILLQETGLGWKPVPCRPVIKG